MPRTKEEVEWCKEGIFPSMALNIKNREVEELATEVASIAHETKTEAIRRALEERKVRLRAHGMKPKLDLRKFLEEHVWPFIPPEAMGKPPMTREEEDEIMGYGPEGF
jgi:antitoxin VapB